MASIPSSASAIPAATQANASTSNKGKGFASLDSSKFLKIILNELQHQDPLKPNDTGAMVQQLSSLRNIESQTQLQDSLKALVSQNSISAGSRFIGKYVRGQDAGGHDIAGMVSSLRIVDGKPVLKLQDGSSLPADRITDVQDTASLDPNTLQGLLSGMKLLDSSALIGKRIEGANTQGQTVTGRVTAIRSDQDGLAAELDTGQTLPVTGIQRVTGPAGPAAAGA